MASPANRKNLLTLKPLRFAGSLATSIAVTATPSFAKIDNLGHTDLAEPITAKAGDNCYLITAHTNIKASQSSWGKTEQDTNGNANTPWAKNGDSALLAGQYTEYAFFREFFAKFGSTAAKYAKEIWVIFCETLINPKTGHEPADSFVRLRLGLCWR